MLYYKSVPNADVGGGGQKIQKIFVFPLWKPLAIRLFRFAEKSPSGLAASARAPPAALRSYST